MYVDCVIGSHRCLCHSVNALFFFAVSLTNLKQTQQIHFGVKDQIVVGAMSFPLTKFTWKKDGQPLDFDGGRITLEKDGSLTFSVVKRTDGGIYDVDMNWENRNTAQKKINVAVVGQ